MQLARITGCDVSFARSFLRINDWNLQLSVNAMMAGDVGGVRYLRKSAWASGGAVARATNTVALISMDVKAALNVYHNSLGLAPGAEIAAIKIQQFYLRTTFLKHSQNSSSHKREFSKDQTLRESESINDHLKWHVQR